MMASITESSLVTRVRQRADMESNNFVSDVEVQTYINGSIAELHDLLIQVYGQDYYVSSNTFTTTAGTDTYALSTSAGADFYKLRGMDAKLNGSDFFTLSPFNFNERNIRQEGSLSNVLGVANLRYRLVGSNIIFTPTPDANTEIRVWFVPTAQQFSSSTPATSTTTYDDFNGYAEYVVIDAAIKCLQKEESDVSVLLGQKAAMKRRIEEAANNRDAGHPLTISDVYLENNEFLLWQEHSLMSLRRFNKVFKPQDQEFNRLQDSIEQAVNPIIDSRIVDGVYIKEVDLSTADTFVEHKLGREPLGFIVVRKFAAGDVFESLNRL